MMATVCVHVALTLTTHGTPAMRTRARVGDAVHLLGLSIGGDALDVSEFVDAASVSEPLRGQATGIRPETNGRFGDSEDAGGVSGGDQHDSHYARIACANREGLPRTVANGANGAKIFDKGKGGPEPCDRG